MWCSSLVLTYSALACSGVEFGTIEGDERVGANKEALILAKGRMHCDFDGDARCDYVTWRPSTGNWAVKWSSAYSDRIRSAFRGHAITIPKGSDQGSGAIRS